MFEDRESAINLNFENSNLFRISTFGFRISVSVLHLRPIPNPNLEIRNPKQIRKDGNSKMEETKAETPGRIIEMPGICTSQARFLEE